MDVVVEEEPTPMEMDTATVEEKSSEAPKKKKKKKASYKNMMAGMLQGGPKDIEKQKEKLREVTGGGTFTKIEKI
jgi:hypothetical protein